MTDKNTEEIFNEVRQLIEAMKKENHDLKQKVLILEEQVKKTEQLDQLRVENEKLEEQKKEHEKKLGEIHAILNDRSPSESAQKSEFTTPGPEVSAETNGEKKESESPSSEKRETPLASSLSEENPSSEPLRRDSPPLEHRHFSARDTEKKGASLSEEDDPFVDEEELSDNDDDFFKNVVSKNAE